MQNEKCYKEGPFKQAKHKEKRKNENKQPLTTPLTGNREFIDSEFQLTAFP